jgi:hypothetical protein
MSLGQQVFPTTAPSIFTSMMCLDVAQAMSSATSYARHIVDLELPHESPLAFPSRYIIC